MEKILQDRVFNLLMEKQFATVEQLAETLNVSQSTIRRKLASLKEAGLVIRKHGGASLADSVNYCPSFSFRMHKQTLEKRQIAIKALKLINNGNLIFLDSSSTSNYIAEYLSEFDNLRVITNGIDTLMLLAKNKMVAYSTGGKISSANNTALIGDNAVQDVCSFYADICFVSASSVTENGDVFDYFEDENVIRRHMTENSMIKVLLVDYTKFGKKGQFKLGNVNDFDYVVTDKEQKDFFKIPIKTKIIF